MFFFFFLKQQIVNGQTGPKLPDRSKDREAEKSLKNVN